MKHVETRTTKQRLCAIIAAGTLAASTMGAPLVAFADPAEGGSQTGTGSTSVYVQMPSDTTDIGGTEDAEHNPDGNDDGLGDNIAFTVPTAINFVAKPNGDLIGPEAAATFIENESAFKIHASSMRVETESAWNLVKDVNGEGVTAANSVDFKFGPANDQLDAADYIAKRAVSDKTQWEMEYAKEGETVIDDRVQLSTSGHIARVGNDIKTKSKIATIHTYVTQGAAPAAPIEPVQP